MLTLLIFDRSYVNVSSMYEALSFGSCSQEFEMQNLALNLSLHYISSLKNIYLEL